MPTLSAIDCYIKDTSGHGLLSPERERAIAQAAREGDAAAREALILANTRLVIRIAREHLGRGLALEDLVGEGNIGLIRAAKNFRVEKKCRFSTYATYWINHMVGRAAANKGSAVRIPVHIAPEVYRWKRMREGWQGSGAELVDGMGLKPGRRKLLKAAIAVREALANAESAELAVDARARDAARAAQKSEPLDALAEHLGRLPAEGRKILEMRYEGSSFGEIARELGPHTNAGRVRVEHDRSLASLRRSMTAARAKEASDA